jgi:hypothetical protein
MTRTEASVVAVLYAAVVGFFERPRAGGLGVDARDLAGGVVLAELSQHGLRGAPS